MRTYVEELRAVSRDRWQTIGGPQALSTAVLVAIVAFLFFGSFINGHLRLGMPVDESLTRFAIGSVSCVGLLVLARMTILPCRPRPARPWLTVAAFASAIAAAALVTNTVFQMQIPTDDVVFGAYANPIGTFLVFSLMAAFIAGSLARSRELRAEANAQQASLLNLRNTHEADLRSAKQSLEQEVSSRLESRIAGIEEALIHVDPEDQVDIRKASELLVETVREIIRPLSYSLASQERRISRTNGKISTAGWVYAPDPRYNIANTIQPGWATLFFCGLSYISAQQNDGDWLGSTIRVAIGLIVLPMLLVIKRFWPQPQRGFRWLAAFIILIATYFVVFTLARAIYLWIQGFAPELLPPAYNPGLFQPIAVIMGSILGLAGLMTEQRRMALNELRDVTEKVRLENARLRQEVWLVQRKLSWHLHGQLQSALVSASITLNQAHVTREQLDQVRRNITEARQDLLSTEQQQGSLEQTLLEIRQLWSDSCQIDWDWNSNVNSMLNERSTLSPLIAEIVREGVSNAIRHGNATQVSVLLRQHSPDTLDIFIRNDGRALEREVRDGLGTSILEQICLDWSRTNTDTVVELHAVIAI
jgi:signal transduction histidine kinase